MNQDVQFKDVVAFIRHNDWFPNHETYQDDAEWCQTLAVKNPRIWALLIDSVCLDMAVKSGEKLF